MWWHQPSELFNSEWLVPTVKGSGGCVMLWITFSWNGLGAVIPLEGKVNANRYLIVLSDLQRLLQHFFPSGSGVFQDENTPIHRARVFA